MVILIECIMMDIFIHEQYGEWGAELRDWLIELGYKETLIDYPLHEVHLHYA